MPHKKSLSAKYQKKRNILSPSRVYFHDQFKQIACEEINKSNPNPVSSFFSWAGRKAVSMVYDPSANCLGEPSSFNCH